MRRTTHLMTVGLGAVIVLLLGSGLFALTSDTAASTDNEILSGTFTPPSHDLDIAQLSASSDCSQGSYTESSAALIAVSSGPNLDLQNGGRIESGFDFCVKNNGTAAGRLTVQFTSVSDTEAACSPNEDVGGADVSCGTGAGELRPMLRPALTNGSALDTSDCTGAAAAAWSTYESTAQQLDASLAPGETCRIHVTINQTSPATDALRFAAQSDRVTWTIAFVLQD